MTEVLIDVTRLLDRGLRGRLPTGVDRVSLEYVRHFRRRALAIVRFAGRWVGLGGTDSLRVFDALLDPGPRFGAVVRWCVGKNYALRWSPVSGPRVLFNTGHSGLDRLDYAPRLHRAGFLPVFFLHDLIPITHPEYCRAGEPQKHRRRLDTMLSAGAALIVNSAATLASLEAHAAAAGRAIPPCVVAPLAPGRLPAGEQAPPLDAPYFVMLGTIEPRKNHWLMLHVWRDLAERLGAAAPRLVIIGQVGWDAENVLAMLERCERIGPHVIHRQACSDEELAGWLKHARALLFPSFVEGYGLPLVEALSLGLPVIASDLPAFREVAGDVPDYLSPVDGNGWKAAVAEYAAKAGGRRAAQLERLRDYRAPTWPEHFARVDSLLERVGAAAR